MEPVLTSVPLGWKYLTERVCVFARACVNVCVDVCLYLCFGIFKMVTDSRDVVGQRYVAPERFEDCLQCSSASDVLRF